MSNLHLPHDKIKKNLNKFIPPLMANYHIPGLSIAMFKKGTIFGHCEFGEKNTQSHEPVEATTVFEGASFSKPLLAYAALKMCQQGQLAIDTPLRNYLSEPYRDDPPKLELITLRHILNHTSGFPELTLTPQEKLKIWFNPGSYFNYSTASFNYLSTVMQSIVKVPLADYLLKNILQPLHMENSSFVWEDKFEKLCATGHNRLGEATEKWKPKNVIGGCSLHTTAIDYAKFMIATLEQAKVAPQDLAINMLNEKVSVEKNMFTSMGWCVERTKEGDVFYHVGNNVTFKSMALAFQEQEFGVVFMTNSINGYKIFEPILDFTVGGKHQDIIEFEDFASEDNHINAMGEKYIVKWWYAYGI